MTIQAEELSIIVLFHLQRKRGRGQHGGKEHGGPHKGQKYRMSYPRLGFEGGPIPFYTKIPNEPYYSGHQ